MYLSQCFITIVTFFGEKLLGIFSRHCELSRDFPQQFNDQSYVICIEEYCQQNKNSLISTMHASWDTSPGTDKSVSSLTLKKPHYSLDSCKYQTFNRTFAFILIFWTSAFLENADKHYVLIKILKFKRNLARFMFKTWDNITNTYSSDFAMSASIVNIIMYILQQITGLEISHPKQSALISIASVFNWRKIDKQ